MPWLTHHKASEELAAEAESQRRQGDLDAAKKLYSQAGREEASALRALDPAKRRTLGILAVSATSLHYKAREFDLAERLAAHYLASGFFLRSQLRNFETCSRRLGVSKFVPTPPLSSRPASLLSLSRADNSLKEERR